MWGTLVVTTTSTAIVRFIPTHVGNTFSVLWPRSSRSVHPHACGEHTSSKALNLQRYFQTKKSTDDSIPKVAIKSLVTDTLRTVILR